MTRTGHDTLGTRKTLKVDGKDYDYFSLEEASKKIGDVSRLPYTLKVLLENLLRFEDGRSVKTDDIKALAEWLTAPDNPFFARMLANRYWKHFFHRALVEPEDDLRQSTEDQHAGERDTEGRYPEPGHEPALRCANRRTGRKADHDGGQRAHPEFGRPERVCHHQHPRNGAHEPRQEAD